MTLSKGLGRRDREGRRRDRRRRRALVGRVTDVGPTFAIVTLISDRSLDRHRPDSRRTRAKGDVIGQLGGALIMQNIDLDRDDPARRAGASPPGSSCRAAIRSPYPKGLLIGQVTDVRRDASCVVQTAYLQPTTRSRQARVRPRRPRLRRRAAGRTTQPINCDLTGRAGRCPGGEHVLSSRAPRPAVDGDASGTVNADEGNRARRRDRDAAVPADHRHQQAPAADLRPADDLLPDRDARRDGDPRGHGHRRRQERRRRRRAPRRRPAFRPRPDVPLPARARSASPTPSASPATSSATTRSAACSATTSSADRPLAPVARRSSRPARGRRDVCSTGSRTRSGSASPSSTRTGNVVGFEEKPAQPKSDLIPIGVYFLRPGRLRRHRRASPRPGAASSRSPTC